MAPPACTCYHEHGSVLLLHCLPAVRQLALLSNKALLSKSCNLNFVWFGFHVLTVLYFAATLHFTCSPLRHEERRAKAQRRKHPSIMMKQEAITLRYHWPSHPVWWKTWALDVHLKDDKHQRKVCDQVPLSLFHHVIARGVGSLLSSFARYRNTHWKEHSVLTGSSICNHRIWYYMRAPANWKQCTWFCISLSWVSYCSKAFRSEPVALDAVWCLK